MKYLITLLIAALSFNAFGQGIPQLPYNPDENGDGLIGVPDLQALLAQYSLEFNSAVLSEDAQSAIVYMGNMAHPVCTQACNNLPGFWNMSTVSDLGLIWEELSTTVAMNAEIWVRNEHPSSGFWYRSSAPIALYTTNTLIESFECYCATHELPKVEYSFCATTSLQSCADELVSNGWYPLNGIHAQQLNGGNQRVQAFWRWAVE